MFLFLFSENSFLFARLYMMKVHETRSHAQSHASGDEEKGKTRKQKADNKTQEAEQAQKKAKPENENDNGRGHPNGKPSTDVAKEFDEFCKAVEGQLSVEQMRETLEANGQDSSGPDVAVVTKWSVQLQHII